jgi:galactose mutarotase-like enzyme
VSTSLKIERFRGAAGLILRAGALSATFLPELGMAGGSVRIGQHELVVLRGGTRSLAGGHTGGIPFLHPYANRLGKRRYEAAGVDVDLRRVELHADPSGLPMHGTLLGNPNWSLTSATAHRRAASVTATLAYDRPELLEAFPFPHQVELAITLTPESLTVATTVRPLGDRPVPISFGWHPYLRVPGRPSTWHLVVPAREHLAVDRRLIPTGRATPEAAEDAVLGDRRFDDGYALGPDRHFALVGRGVRLDVDFDEGYPFAQLYRLPDGPFACIEPMTAPTNALVTGAHPTVAPGESFTAAFELRPRLT